jgi:gliding motility-associated-like protein
LWIGGSDSTSTAAWGGQDQVFVEVVGANNCIGYDTISIQMVPNPFIDLPDQILLCDTALVEVTAFMPGATYLWETGETTASIIVGEGIWSLEAFAVCSAYDSIEVIVGNVDFTLGNDKRICDGQTIFIAPEINNLDSLHWYDGTEGNIFTYADQYDPEDTLMISAMAYGCGDTGDTVLIYVIDCDCPIFVPNTFTPNGDEYNHAFRIAHNCTFEEFEFIIYNRWGETIFESYDDNFVWDGTNGLGKQVQDGTYVWRMRYKNAFDIEMTDVREKTGHINVIR